MLTQTGFFTAFGILLAYAIGPFVTYEVTCWLATGTAFIYLVLIILIVPETPLYQVMKGKNYLLLETIIFIGSYFFQLKLKKKP